MPIARRPWPAALAAAVALLAFGIVRDAWPWIADDAFISLRYAERFAGGNGLTWTDGERVEGYSNLLWVLLLSVPGWLGIDLIAAARALGIACTVCTFAALLVRGAQPATPPAAQPEKLLNALPAPLVVAALAAQASIATWAIGGLEAPLVLLLLAITALGLSRGLDPDERAPRGWLGAAGAALALLAWTRPDGPLWAAVAAGTALLFDRSRATVVLLLGPAVLAVGLQLGFRLAYYGEWLPNTAHAKLGSDNTAAAGLAYLASAATSMRALLLPACLGFVPLVRDRRARPVLFFAAAGALAWSLYLLRVGGDVFPRNRLALPLLVCAALFAGHGIHWLGSVGRAGRALAWVVVLGSICLARLDAERPADDAHQQLSDWEWTGVATGEWLHRAFAEEQPLLAVDAAGAVPFASKLPCLDMLGLCDRIIARTPPAEGEGFVVGHNRGNGAYVLSRRPDIVLFWAPPGNPQPRWPSGVQMESDPLFLLHYRMVLFDMQTPATELPITAWVRLDGRIGAERDGARVTLPGWWLGSYRQPMPLRLFVDPLRPGDPEDAERQRVVAEGASWWQLASVVGVFDAQLAETVGEVRRAGRYLLPELPLPAGTWSARALGAPDGVTLTVEHSATDPSLADVLCTVPDGTVLPFRVTDLLLERER
jgi:hypothetical protein